MRIIKIFHGIDSFKMIHGAGYIYNDLKFDNILVGPDDNLRIIDLGLSSRFVDSKGTHIKF